MYFRFEVGTLKYFGNNIEKVYMSLYVLIFVLFLQILAGSSELARQDRIRLGVCNICCLPGLVILFCLRI